MNTRAKTDRIYLGRETISKLNKLARLRKTDTKTALATVVRDGLRRDEDPSARCEECRKESKEMKRRLERVQDWGLALQDLPSSKPNPETLSRVVTAVGAAVEFASFEMLSELRPYPTCDHEELESEFPKPAPEVGAS